MDSVKKDNNQNCFTIIENNYLDEHLYAQLEQSGITLLYVETKLLKSIGARIEATIFRNIGVSHEDCSLCTQTIKSIINEKYGNADEYTITVSSPGFKWLFRGERELKVFQNAPVKIVYTKEASLIIGAKTISGILLSSDKDSIEIENEKDNMTILRDAIAKIYLNY